MGATPNGSRPGSGRALFVVTAAAALLAFLGPLSAYDLWWHLTGGRLVLETGRVPTADLFSFTAYGKPWTYHSWLSGVVLSLAWDAGGAAGLMVLRSLLLAAALMISWRVARNRGLGAGLASALVLCACLQMKVRAMTRPYLFSFVIFAVFLLVLDAAAHSESRGRSERRSGRWLALEDGFLWGARGRLLLLPFLMVLWANLHAGFISGFLVLGAYGAGELLQLAVSGGEQGLAPRALTEPAGARFRAMLVSGVLCLAACVVTPHAAGALLYPFRLMRSVQLVKRVNEWKPTPFEAGFAVFWGVVIVGALILARSALMAARAGKLRANAGRYLTDLLLLGGFTVLALQAVRHMAWVLLVAPPVLGWHLVAAGREDDDTDAGRPGDKRIYTFAAMVLAFAVGVLPFIQSGMPTVGLAAHKFPARACDFIERESLSYRLYNSYEWGGYLIWRLWPVTKVFIDGRCLVYGDDLIGQALKVEDAEPGWPDVLKRWDVEMLVVRYRKRDCSHLFADRTWRCVYWDDLAVVALRADVNAARERLLPEFPLSNPVVFEQSLAAGGPEPLLDEVDRVLERDPECWTAHGFRARALLATAGRAGGSRAAELRAEAYDAASRAVDLQKHHAEPFRALAGAARAVGKDGIAAAAERRAAELADPKDG